MPRLLKTIFALLALITILGAPVALAQTELISPIGDLKQASSPAEYISTIFLYGVGFAALVAVFQLIFGSVQYTMSAGMPSLQESSKERMRSAIVGLIILLVAFSGLLLINRNFSVASNPNLEDVPPPNEGESARRDREITELGVNTELALQRLELLGRFGEAETVRQYMENFLDQKYIGWYNPDILKQEMAANQARINNILDEVESFQGAEGRAAAQRDFDTAFRHMYERAVYDGHLHFSDEAANGLGYDGNRLRITSEQFRGFLDAHVDPRYHPQIMR